MALEAQASAILRFGVFEVDVRAGEVVTREELRSQNWPADTFVDFDNSLNTAINKLREALGDSADNPRFIETLPRRGYRFLVSVTSPDREASASVGAALARGVKRWKVVTPIAVVLVSAVVGGLFWRSRQARRLTDKDTVVLADFVNSTADPVFDGTLREGLSVQLEQSPFLRLVSEEGIQQTLQMMGQPTNVRLTPQIAREVCQFARGPTAPQYWTVPLL